MNHKLWFSYEATDGELNEKSTVDYQNSAHPNYGQNSQVGVILVVYQKMPFLVSFYSFIQKLNVYKLNRKALMRNAVF